MVRLHTVALLSSALVAGASATAQPAPLPAQVSSAASMQVSDTVHCAYDQMSTEDREMALLLFEREIGSGNKTHAGSPNLRVIDRLVDDARARCAASYGWSGIQADAAENYAMNELMGEGIEQALEAKGRSIAPIDEYFAQHRAELAGQREIAGAQAQAFRGFLLDHGWTTSEAPLFGIAEFYLESLLTRESETRRFAAAAPAPRAVDKPKARPSRAKTARSGRP